MPSICNEEGFEDAKVFTLKGEYIIDDITDSDLMMVTEKKQGWVNVYKSTVLNITVTDGYVYETKEIAKHNAKDDDDYIGTFPFEWEE